VVVTCFVLAYTDDPHVPLAEFLGQHTGHKVYINTAVRVRGDETCFKRVHRHEVIYLPATFSHGSVYDWSCRHCEYSVSAGDKRALIDQVKSHLVRSGGGILVYNSPTRTDEGPACTDLLTVRNVPNTGVLWITKSPAERLDLWRRHADGWPQRLQLLVPPSATVTEDLFDRSAITDGPAEVTELSSTSLEKLGRQIADNTSTLAEECRCTTVCFDNLSNVIHEFGNRSVFKLVHVLNVTMHNAGALAHYHMEPETHIGSTTHIFEQEFQLLRDWSGEEPELSLP
jgi:hypothetical protein